MPVGRVQVQGVRSRGNDAAVLSSRYLAVIGDSLTERAFGSTPIYWQHGLIGAPMQLIANSGFSGQSIFGLIGQIENDYTAATAPGLIGLPRLALIGLRIGTNTVRGAAGSTGIPLSTQNQENYQTVIDRLLDFAEHVVIFPVPPIGGSSITRNTEVPAYNTFLQGLVSADTTGRLHWIDDCADLVDGSGNVRPEFFDVDELHMNGAGGYQMALTSESAWESLMAELYGPQWRRSRLVTTSADVYPAQSQWASNPTGIGTGGTFGSGWSGTLPNGWRVENNGAGLAGTCSIVAADAGDPNQTPWVRITPTASAAANIALTMPAAGRTITASDPPALEQLVELRGNDFRGFNDFNFWLQAGGQRLTPNARLRWGASIGFNRRVTLQQRHYRTGSTGGTPLLYCYISSPATYGGAMGSIDVRCPSVRG